MCMYVCEREREREREREEKPRKETSGDILRRVDQTGSQVHLVEVTRREKNAPDCQAPPRLGKSLLIFINSFCARICTCGTYVCVCVCVCVS